MKVVLDTNVLVSGIFWGGRPLKVLTLWEKRKIDLLVTDSILDEYLRTIHRIAERLDRASIYKAWALVLPAKVTLIAVKKSFRLCRDPKGDMFIDCAIAGKSRSIVTGDKDLLVLKTVLGVPIVDATHFLAEFKTQERNVH
ncbi:MAG: putative toxin-antitoxin system toxin component, PIN family [Deltaproteobacteria bacterium]|nr:putative toxin-antitoxin system toxin component, PIN family [Deltaproteobacteria bacterium]MBI3293255.1 putative toxin-antitoxin system toxin component, PIN family [Deltaproteobacteria bacterium]